MRHWWLCKYDEVVVAVVDNTSRARAKMGFSPLIVDVAIVWGRMTSSPGNGEVLVLLGSIGRSQGWQMQHGSCFGIQRAKQDTVPRSLVGVGAWRA